MVSREMILRKEFFNYMAATMGQVFLFHAAHVRSSELDGYNEIAV